MSPTTRTRGRSAAVAAAWVAAGAIGATALTGLAVAAPGGASTSGTVAVAGQTDDQASGRERLRAFLHGEITVQGADGPTTLDLQRGEVTAATATSVTVRSSDGFTTAYAVGSSTTVRRDRATVTADALAVGDTAFVRAEGTTATTIRALSPEGLAKAKERMQARAGDGSGLRGLLGGAGG